jgi:hypothetical protein
MFSVAYQAAGEAGGRFQENRPDHYDIKAKPARLNSPAWMPPSSSGQHRNPLI